MLGKLKKTSHSLGKFRSRENGKNLVKTGKIFENLRKKRGNLWEIQEKEIGQTVRQTNIFYCCFFLNKNCS